jgi:hypothetical protein
MSDSTCLSSVSSGDFQVKIRSPTWYGTPTITTVSLFKTNPIITEDIYLTALPHTDRQAAICIAVYHCATPTDFDNQFQPNAFNVFKSRRDMWPAQLIRLYLTILTTFGDEHLHKMPHFTSFTYTARRRFGHSSPHEYNYLLHVTRSTRDWEPKCFGRWSLIVCFLTFAIPCIIIQFK